MAKTTGRSSIIQLMIDYQLIIYEHKQAVRMLLRANQDAIEADMSDDLVYKEADDQLGEALIFVKDMNAESWIRKARQTLKRGIKIDIDDKTKEQLQAQLLAFEERLDDCLMNIHKLLSELHDNAQHEVSMESCVRLLSFLVGGLSERREFDADAEIKKILSGINESLTDLKARLS